MKNSILIFSVLILLSYTANAQKSFYGHVNGDAIIQKMPEFKKANEDLTSFIKGFEDYAKKMNDEYTLKVEDFKSKEATMSELIKKNEIESINALNDKMQKYQVSAQDEINKKKAEMYKPVISKFNAALKAVADKKGLKFIIDNSKGVLLYYSAEDDVTKAVETELGIQ